ncbi:putative serine/threonine protein kinase [Blattamonas nauphoetae]|uniref:non-specific serine/threonine protein kinase n=1 Tax=Blattamonas nauphoetae TaxID=2049346 RepID=A0ABQ9Y9E9_9EUKA|nr:putative serine/threonine protein kinase [Blattamonas nauphoetae]
MTKVVNGYSFTEVIGEGSSGQVYKVIHLPTGNTWAIKEISKSGDIKEEDVVKEILAMKEANSPFVVQFRECFQDQHNLYIVMELCEHGTLERELINASQQQHEFLEETLWLFAKELSQGLCDLKAKRIIHRDIKPANIYITADNHLRLGDMGYSRQLAHTLDMTVSPLGTPFYAAPEILNFKGYSFPCDVWSLGVTLYQLATQELPFESNNKTALFNMIKTQPPRPIRRSLSQDFCDLVMAMLEKNPQNRITIEEVNHRASLH